MSVIKMPCVNNNFDDNLQVPTSHIRVSSEDFDIEVPGGSEDPILRSKGRLPEEVKNAVETGGLGYTEEEVIPGFDIQWDGNIEGKEPHQPDVFGPSFFKVYEGVTTFEELKKATLT